MSTDESKALYMATLGCPKNRVDSEVMLGTLGARGYRLVESPAEAAVIVVNTCAFIGPAKQESVDTILELAEYKKSGQCSTLVVTGCLSQRYGPELAKEMPEVDHFLGTGAYVQIGDLLAAEAAPRQVIPDPHYVHDARTPKVNSSPKWTAYLKISEGCDNACAFCIIPTLRGAQRSRPIDDLVAEARTLAASGVRELNLVAQDLTAYGHDLPGKPQLHQLLEALCTVDVRWIRLHYAYPRVFPDALIDVMAREPKIAKYLDMPLQHASDRLLRSMRRGRDSAFLVALLAKLRARIPGLTFRTSLIAGLPGETEEDFELLKEFVRTAALRADGLLPVLGRGRHGGLRLRGQGAAEGHRAALAGDHGHPEAHQPRAEPCAHRQAARGAGGGTEPGVGAPARRTPRGPGPGHRRAGLHQRRVRLSR